MCDVNIKLSRRSLYLTQSKKAGGARVYQAQKIASHERYLVGVLYDIYCELRSVKFFARLP